MDETVILQATSLRRSMRPLQKMFERQYAPRFNLAGALHHETAWTKIIALLLDPEGLHGQGRIFLDHFLRSIDIDPKYIHGEIKVKTEYTISERVTGRIDIAILSLGPPIAIEVKIDAKDGKTQLQRYSTGLARKFGTAPYIVYLSRYGSLPSDLARGHISVEQIKVLSLSAGGQGKKNLSNILRTAGQACQADRVSAFVRMFADALDTLGFRTANFGDPETMALLEFLQDSPEHLETAMLLNKLIDEVRISLVRRFGLVVKEEITKKLASPIDWIEETMLFADRRPNSYEDIALAFRRSSWHSDVCVRIEVAKDDGYFGIAFVQEPKNSTMARRFAQILADDQHAPDDSEGIESRWPWWRYFDGTLKKIFTDAAVLQLARMCSVNGDRVDLDRIVSRIIQLANTIERLDQEKLKINIDNGKSVRKI